MAVRWVVIRAADRRGVARLDLAGDATVAHLAGALGAAGAPVSIDGRSVTPEERLIDALAPGAEVEVGAAGGSSGTGRPTEAGAHLAVTGGLSAGRTVPLPSGEAIVVGRAPGCDLRLPCPTVSPRHLAVTSDPTGAQLRDLGSRNGTWGPGGHPHPPRHDTEVRVGAHRLRVRPAVASGQDGLAAPDPATGRHPFDRGFAPPGPTGPPPPRIPAVPEHPTTRTTFSLSLVIGPLLLAGGLALVVSPALAALALLSPVLAGLSWAEGRWTERRRRRGAAAARAAALVAFRAAVEAQRAHATVARRVAHPDPSVVVARAQHADRRLWHRRPGHRDWMALRLGTGSLPWAPHLDGRPDESSPEARAVLDEVARLTDVPVTVDASAGSVVAVVGRPEVTAAVGRALLLDAAVHQGPADLRISVDSDRPATWRWARWLPHHVDGWGVGSAGDDGGTDGRHLLVVTDRAHALRPGTPARAALDRPGGGAVIVLTGDRSGVPDRCSAVVTATDDVGGAQLQASGTGGAPSDLLLDGVPVDVADRAARALARLSDPEGHAGATLAARVRLADLAPWPETAADLRQTWEGCPPGSLVVTLGAGTGGPVAIDLVADGPHALVAGTTGSGKSELLRTLVASLASRHPPDHVTFVLVDFKGGSAFDACADLPHTVGLVTDLDGRLGERAVRSLEAELRRRERLLRTAGCRDLTEHHARSARGEVPAVARLVIVIDEFATLASQLPDVLGGVVDVAQRGRSLGVHLVLATQRPAGVVSDQIRANTDLRVALRVVDAADSTDVVGDRAATSLPADRPGRAVLQRAGRREVVQVATVSAAADRPPPVRIAWVADDAERHGGAGGAGDGDGTRGEPPGSAPEDRPGRTDLHALAEQATMAWQRRREAEPHLDAARHRPWLPPLPDRVTADELLAATGSTAGWPLALADDPDRQRRVPLHWDPGDGPLLLYGQRGSGCTTALQTAVLVASRRTDPAALQAYAVTATPDEWGRVAGLPTLGAVVDVRDLDRLQRLVDLVLDEPAPAGRRVLLAVDEVRTFLDALDALGGVRTVDAVLQGLAGAHRGLAVAASSERVSAVPGLLSAVAAHRWCFRLPDAYDYAAFGLPAIEPRHLPPGRGLSVETGLELQVAWAEPVDPSPVAGDPRFPEGAGPDRLDALPTDLRARDLGGPGLVVGLADRPREPVAWELTAGDRVLVAGPSGSGRSTVLAAIADAHGRGALPTGCLVVTGAPRSPLRTAAPTAAAWRPPEEAWGAVLDAGDGTLTVLVDDVELAPDPPAEVVARLIGSHVLLVVAAHTDRLRSTYQHWTAPLRRARYGLALRPHESDGEVWATTLPRGRTPGWPPGRAYLIDHGQPRLLQVARP